jgi:hypothetical protein
MTIEVLWLFGGNYAIFDLDGHRDPLELSSADDLRDHLRSLGFSEYQIDAAMEDVKTEPRRVMLTVKSLG